MRCTKAEAVPPTASRQVPCWSLVGNVLAPLSFASLELEYWCALSMRFDAGFVMTAGSMDGIDGAW